MSDVNVRVGLTKAGFDSGLAKLRSELKGFRKEQESAFAGMGNKLAGAFALIGGGAGIKSIIDFGGALQDSADALGVNVEAMQELHFAFGQSGASAANVDKSLMKLSQTLDAARSGNKEAIAAFQKLGVTLSDIQRLAPDEILMKLAAGFKDNPNRAEALSAALEVLGRSGRTMAAGLAQGADELARLRSEADKLDEDSIQKLDMAGDALSRLGNKLKVLAGGTLIGLKEIFRPVNADAQTGTSTGPATPEEIATARAAKNARDGANLPVTMRPSDKEMAESEKLWQDMEDFKKQAANQRIEDERAAQKKADEEAKDRAEKLADLKKQLAEAETRERMDQLREVIRAEEAAAEKEAQARREARERAIEAQLAGPDAARAARREAAKRARAESSVDRKSALAERRGLSQVDYDAKVRLGEIIERKDVRPERIDAAKTELRRLEKAAGDITAIRTALNALQKQIGVG